MLSAYLCCPSYPLADQTITQETVVTAGRLCHALGWRLVVSPLLDLHPGPGVWLPAAQRTADLRRALGHEVVIAARGGYGAIELADALLAHAGPWPVIVGYSDVTILHAAAWRAGAPAGVYGFMPAVTGGPLAFDSAVQLLSGGGCALDLACGGEVLRAGSASGRLFPACLRVLAGLVGTPLMPDLSSAILAIEDIDERPYRLDRDLNQLHLAGALRGVSGLVGGRFRCARPDNDLGPEPRDILRAWAERLGVPAVSGVPFGHERDPISLPVGAMAELRVDGADWSLATSP
jgi:muramoyltetrapeptide carboxypeptidase